MTVNLQEFGNNAGIDYGRGIVNRDKENPLFHYGVISQNHVLQAWADSSEPWYGDKEEIDDFDEPLSFLYKADGYICESDNYGDIFITKSPYYTICAYCSPCAPGAGYIMDTRDEGIKTYCFGHDWFDEGKAPYPVYDIKTGKRVKK